MSFIFKVIFAYFLYLFIKGVFKLYLAIREGKKAMRNGQQNSGRKVEEADYEILDDDD